MTAAPFLIRRTTEQDWAETRALRLEMLADTPHAYLETVADAAARDEAGWRERARRTAGPGAISLAAILTGGEETGRWVGTMAAILPEGAAGARLVGVYVAPDWRGAAAGVSGALLAGIEEWAGLHGDVLTLEVHQDSTAARRFYKRHGFEETGAVHPYPLDRSRLEFEMAKPLRAEQAGGARLLGGGSERQF
ncbi:GNAT family N-acetyltransferase [Microterricola viridarii]|nr:GNAT family N-acetyltransferase [Microterricola viridarii]